MRTEAMMAAPMATLEYRLDQISVDIDATKKTDQ